MHSYYLTLGGLKGARRLGVRGPPSLCISVFLSYLDFSKEPQFHEKKQLGLKPLPNSSRAKALMFQIAKF